MASSIWEAAAAREAGVAADYPSLSEDEKVAEKLKDVGAKLEAA